MRVAVVELDTEYSNNLNTDVLIVQFNKARINLLHCNKVNYYMNIKYQH